LLSPFGTLVIAKTIGKLGLSLFGKLVVANNSTELKGYH